MLICKIVCIWEWIKEFSNILFEVQFFSINPWTTDLQLSSVGVTRVCKEAKVTCVSRKSDQSVWVWWSTRDDVDHFHVSDVVDVQALLQTNNQPLNRISLNNYLKNIHSYRSIHPNSSDFVIVGVATYFCPLFKMAHSESPWILSRDYCHKTAREQSLSYIDVGLI